MGDQGEWLPLSKASQELGVSVQTLRRRIKEKQIEARQATTPFGFAWEVLVNSVDRDGEEPINTADLGDQGVNTPIQGASAASLEMISALNLIERLQASVVEKTEIATMWQTRAHVLAEQVSGLQVQLGQAHETIKALDAPRPPEATRIEEPSSEGKSWWRRLFSSGHGLAESEGRR